MTDHIGKWMVTSHNDFKTDTFLYRCSQYEIAFLILRPTIHKNISYLIITEIFCTDSRNMKLRFIILRTTTQKYLILKLKYFCIIGRNMKLNTFHIETNDTKKKYLIISHNWNIFVSLVTWNCIFSYCDESYKNNSYLIVNEIFLNR